MDRSLQIAIDARPALWPTTGIGTIVRNVVLRIQQIDPGNRYKFYFDRDPAEIRDRLGAESCFFHPRANKLLWANTYIRRELARSKADVYITFLDKEIPFFVGRTKALCMVHDLIPLRFPETVFRNALHRLYYRTLIGAATRGADIVLTNSEYSRRELVDLLRVPEKKIRRITLGVAANETAPDHRLLKRLELHSDYVLAVGSTEPRKNNEMVIRAFDTISARHPSLKLVIAGKEWRGRKFHSSLLSDRVILAGFVSDNELAALMESAKALVFPSLAEGFGFPVLEAMALGTPVITSQGTALPEVGGESAIYVDPNKIDEIANAMDCLMNDPGLRSELSAKGRARAKHFRWETTCRELASICREVSS
jgi:glycosyltransferase involved in cell wall biosynthesis